MAAVFDLKEYLFDQEEYSRIGDNMTPIQLASIADAVPRFGGQVSELLVKSGAYFAGAPCLNCLAYGHLPGVTMPGLCGVCQTRASRKDWRQVRRQREDWLKRSKLGSGVVRRVEAAVRCARPAEPTSSSAESTSGSGSGSSTSIGVGAGAMTPARASPSEQSYASQPELEMPLQNVPGCHCQFCETAFNLRLDAQERPTSYSDAVKKALASEAHFPWRVEEAKKVSTSLAPWNDVAAQEPSETPAQEPSDALELDKLMSIAQEIEEIFESRAANSGANAVSGAQSIDPKTDAIVEAAQSIDPKTDPIAEDAQHAAAPASDSAKCETKKDAPVPARWWPFW